MFAISGAVEVQARKLAGLQSTSMIAGKSAAHIGADRRTPVVSHR
jgi:hypothetical protein